MNDVFWSFFPLWWQWIGYGLILCLVMVYPVGMVLKALFTFARL